MTHAGLKPTKWGGKFSLFGGGMIWGELYAHGVDEPMLQFVVEKVTRVVNKALGTTCDEPHEVPSRLDSISARMTELSAADLQLLGGGYVYVLGLTGGEIPAGTKREPVLPAEMARAVAAVPTTGGPAPAFAPFVPPAVPVPAPVVTHQPEPAVDSLNVTAEGAMSPLAMGPVLPFRQGEPARAPAPLAPAPSPDAGATAFVPVIDDLEMVPFSDELPDLTVEQYASLCVERALDPSSQPEVARRYKVLTEEALRVLDARWGKRFDAEGALYQRWQQAYAQYRAWLEAQKR